MYVRSPPGRKRLKAGAQRTLEGVGCNTPYPYGQSPRQNRGGRRGRTGMSLQCFEVYSRHYSPEPVLSSAWFGGVRPVLSSLLHVP